ncbi:hypothetical protein AwErysi_06510 [Erysipelotrichaceae bacterium]|nr:hypothetical protein AwErysi_06510 [Erysipelotrichaceae bacterium]
MRKKINKPKVPKQLENFIYTKNSIEDGELKIKNYAIEKQEITNLEDVRIQLDVAYFKGVTFENISFKDADCMDVVFEKCIFIRCDFSGAGLHRIVFSDCKCVGLQFSDAFLSHVHFIGGVLELVSFSFAKIRNIQFENITCRQTDFFTVDWKDASFTEVRMQSADFTGTNLGAIDFTKTELEAVQISVDLVKGCRVNEQQALAFAAILGLDIQEPIE